MEQTDKQRKGIALFGDAVAESVKFCEETGVEYNTGLACRNDKREMVFSIDVLNGQEIRYSLENGKIVIENIEKTSGLEKALFNISPQFSLKEQLNNYNRELSEIKDKIADIKNGNWLYKLFCASDSRKTQESLGAISFLGKELMKIEANKKITAEDYVKFAVRQIAQKYNLEGDLSFSTITVYGLSPSLKELTTLCEIGKVDCEKGMKLFTTKNSWPVIVETW